MFLRHGTPALLILALCASACGAATGQAPALANPTHPSAATAASATASGPTPTAAASPVPPTESPAPRDFSEPFSGNPKYWAFVEVDNGQPYTKPAVQDGFLVYGLPAANQWAYGLYTGAHYTNVRIETEVQSRTTGDGALGLVCRYDEKNGWYEFNIFADQTYQLLFGQWLAPGVARYTPLYHGESPAIHSDTNQIALDCAGNTLAPFINGAPVKQWPELRFRLERGEVGVSVSSFTDAPFSAAFDWVKVSEP